MLCINYYNGLFPWKKVFVVTLGYVHRTQVLPLLDPKVKLLVVSKHHACTLFKIEKKVEPAFTALRSLHEIFFLHKIV